MFIVFEITAYEINPRLERVIQFNEKNDAINYVKTKKNKRQKIVIDYSNSVQDSGAKTGKIINIDGADIN